MAFLLKRAILGVGQLMTLSDPRTENLFLVRSPVPVFAILFAWAAFVFKCGPEWMKKRGPFKIDRIVMVYDIVQVITNSSLLIYGLRGLHSYRFVCTPIDWSTSPQAMLHIQLHHWYFLLKVFDLLDTVFFVLKKKTQHISFLHVYHHSGVTVGAWLTCKFMPGGQLIFLGLANVVAHAVMYFYYFLTAYNSNFSKIVWLKRRVTELQIVQHAFILTSFLAAALNPYCTYPKLLICFYIPQLVMMLFMFSDFYVKAYLKPKRKET